MKISKYCKIYPSGESPDLCVLFLTKNAAKILVPPSLIYDIETRQLRSDETAELIKLGFLAGDDKTETLAMSTLIDELNETNRTFYAKVVLNLDCNLGCKYCFEGTRKGKYYMSEETIKGLVRFAGSSMFESKEAIEITYYGGEPLLSSGLIIDISEKLRAVADSRGMKYNFSLVTNGTLLRKDLVSRLKPLGLTHANVTIDGTADNHNRYRPFKSGSGSFDTIIGNVKDNCDELQINIGGNYTKENFRRFPMLLDYFLSEGLTPDRLGNIRLSPVTQESGEYANPDFTEGCLSLNEPWLAGAWLYLREEILRRGYRTEKVMPMPCIMEINDSFVINYNGDIYKCPSLIGRNEFCVGNLNSGLIDYRKSHNLDNWKNNECLDCCYLPLCFGGCRYMKLVRDGNMDGIECRKTYFDSVLESLVYQDTKYWPRTGQE
jgi:uncharacterized protein